MDEHPGIVFRSGPAGRRAGLAGGPDIWLWLTCSVSANTEYVSRFGTTPHIQATSTSSSLPMSREPMKLKQPGFASRPS